MLAAGIRRAAPLAAQCSVALLVACFATLGCGTSGRSAPADRPPPTPPEPTKEPHAPAEPTLEFPLGCHRVERPAGETEGPAAATLCLLEDRFVMWGNDMHESRYVVWTERSDTVWSGVSPGDYTRTLELSVERRPSGNVFVLADQVAQLSPLDQEELARAEEELGALPTIEATCEPAHRCLAAADEVRSRVTGENPSEPLVFGKSVVECQIQTVLALRMIPEDEEIPEACRFAQAASP